jgi:D-beta-D-heptose 7-phosphate kinase/D-beta-D-heptose 1-phosphate adenosyltransferase
MIVTVIGEICNDVFVYGDTKRLSPEAPVPVLTHTHVERNLGMAGNVRENLWALNPSLFVVLIHQMDEITKTRYVDDKSNHMFLRVDLGEDNIGELVLTDTQLDEISISDIVIVSDYNKGFLTEETLIEIGRNSKLSIIDTKKKLTKEIVDVFTFIKVNEDEYKRNEDVSNNNKEKFIITLGMKGAKYNDIIYPSPSPKQTMDVSGAGDTFTASFILKYKETNNIKESIIFANEMASIVVSKRGVTTP